MFTYRSAEGGCKTHRNWPIGERLYRFANADMNPVAGWIEKGRFCGIMGNRRCVVNGK